MPPTVDLFTEIRKTPKVLTWTRGFLLDSHNLLVLNGIILFKYCTEMKITLSDGHLGFCPGPYPQSYPQILWVSDFPFRGNTLDVYANALSSIRRQQFEPA